MVNRVVRFLKNGKNGDAYAEAEPETFEKTEVLAGFRVLQLNKEVKNAALLIKAVFIFRHLCFCYCVGLFLWLMVVSPMYTYIPQNISLKKVATALRCNFIPKPDLRPNLLLIYIICPQDYLVTTLPVSPKEETSTSQNTCAWTQENTCLTPKPVMAVSIVGSPLVVTSHIPLTQSGHKDDPC